MLSRRYVAAAIAAVALVPTAYTAATAGKFKPAAVEFPSVNAQGLSFSASVPADPQRDQGEPQIVADNGGVVYTCGPSGFSNIADYAQVSTDGGDQFHLLGTPPRGQISTGEGGGDCGIATAPVPNAEGHYTLAYSGLGPLTNFSTFTTADSGHTLVGSPVSESPPGVDRQWHVFIDEKTVFLNYNQLANGFTVQKSSDGGLTYGAPITVTSEGGRIGQMRAIVDKEDPLGKSIVYFPYDSGTMIKLAMSHDAGTTWTTCSLVDAENNPTAGFVVADNDTAGNIYVSYSEKGEGSNDSYVVALPFSKIDTCADDAEAAALPKTRVNRDSVETTVFAWVVARGAPGRIAVAFHGTDAIGDPNTGGFAAPWNVYVSMSLDALSPNPHWSQVKATTRPSHYNSICLNGLSCDLTVPKGDRSLVDYFTMDLNPKDGRLVIVYNHAAKKPTDELGHVATPTVTVQEGGPSLNGGNLTPRRPVLRDVSVDPEGDALAPYSFLYPATELPATPVPDASNHIAMDIKKVTVGPEIDLASGDKVDDGGFTVTAEIASLGEADLQSAMTGTNSGSLIYVFRFLNGFQPNGASARYQPGLGWTFGYDAYTTKSTESGQYDPTAEKIIVWPGATPIQGDVNADTGIIRLSVPRELLKGISTPADPAALPEEIEAAKGTRFFDATFYAFGSPLPDPRVQSYLYPVDSAPAMDFLLGGSPTVTTQVPGKPKPPAPKPTAPGKPKPAPGNPLPSTGGLGLPLAAVLAAAGGFGLRRWLVRS